MEKLNVKSLPVAENVCAQVLREVQRTPKWTMAHVIMNPFAESLFHSHKKMTEIYVITKGYGELKTGTRISRQVAAGSVYEIPACVHHMLCNKSAGHLEHLVFALPPFDPSDVHVLEEKHLAEEPYALYFPKVEECFDGAKILSYAFSRLDLSIAFGWVINDLTRRKQPHYHKRTTEFVYVVNGKGFIKIGPVYEPIRSGDWIRIDPGTEHVLQNESPEDMVVVCTCSPAFQMEDVHYHV